MPTRSEINTLARELMQRHADYEFGAESSLKEFSRWLAAQYGCSVAEVYEDFRQKAEWELSRAERGHGF